MHMLGHIKLMQLEEYQERHNISLQITMDKDKEITIHVMDHNENIAGNRVHKMTAEEKVKMIQEIMY